MPRLFTALPLPPFLRDALSTLELANKDVRPVPPENLHLTLHFIGETDRASADSMESALEAIAVREFFLPVEGLPGETAPVYRVRREYALNGFA